METIPESHRDLLDVEFATLATVNANGRPQLSVVWFLADGDTINVSLSSSRQKTANLLHNNACSVVILDPKNGYRYLEVRGHIELTPDPDYVFAAQVGAKYGGADLRQYDAPGDTRLKATIVADRVRAINMGG